METGVDKAVRRLNTTVSHIAPDAYLAQEDQGLQLIPEGCSGSSNNNNNPVVPQRKQSIHHLLDSGQRGHHQGKEPLKWNGWGYDDTEFVLNSKGELYLSGNRYSLCGVSFPKLRPWAERLLGLDIQHTSPANKKLPQVNDPIKHQEFLSKIEGQYLKLSFEAADRLFHGHGHTCEDVWRLRYGSIPRLPDAVIWPGKHEQVEAIVKAAAECNVVIIPFGGGTSVSSAIECPEDERRMVISLDMHEMNRIKWIDYESMMACVEAGVVGKDLDAKLSKLGLCMGHEPDSNEFSTLGGWIATRASGMKKNVYGNIEDIIVTSKLVTPIGTLERSCQVPRISAGPDINEVIIGSEGTLGVVTEAVIRLRPLPEVRKYGSIVFPDFESGVACVREIAKQRTAPASIRLMDNLQFQFGQMLKPEGHSWMDEWLDAAKKWYVTNWKGFEVEKMTAATLLFEGNANEVALQESRVYAIAAKHGGLKGGEENGKRGYFLTYMIAYIRDFGFNYYFMAESFETSVPWSNVLTLCNSVKQRIYTACKEHGITYTPFVTCRVTQTYDTGACVYFYFGFIFRNLPDPLKTYIDIESQARDEIIKCGGSISHHHGVGKHRKKWLPPTITPTGVSLLKGIKGAVDPQNIFANGNLV